MALAQAAKDRADGGAGGEELFENTQPEWIGERVECLLLGADQPAELGVVKCFQKRAQIARLGRSAGVQKDQTARLPRRAASFFARRCATASGRSFRFPDGARQGRRGLTSR